MRNIKVTFRAVFHQPIGRLNPLGLKVPTDIPVEVYGTQGNWRVRNPSRIANAFDRLGKFASAEDAKREIARSFARQVEEWQVWGTPPHTDQEQMLTAYDVADLGEGKWGYIQDEDRTHIIHAPAVPLTARIPPAACGASVNAKCFINNRANVEPTCRGCAEVWRKEYKNK